MSAFYFPLMERIMIVFSVVKIWCGGEIRSDRSFRCTHANKTTKGGKCEQLGAGVRNGLGGWYKVVGIFYGLGGSYDGTKEWTGWVHK